MRGFIFRCTNKTKDEVFERKLLGEERMYVPLIKTITVSDLLFLYNLSTYEFIGPYKPKGLGGENLIPNAWKSAFPAQIQFDFLPETKTINFKEIEKIIKIYHKGVYPDMALTEKQLEAILNIIKP